VTVSIPAWLAYGCLGAAALIAVLFVGYFLYAVTAMTLFALGASGTWDRWVERFTPWGRRRKRALDAAWETYRRTGKLP
jgi:hypothetical protein